MAAAADTVRSYVRRASKLLSEKGVTIVAIDTSSQAEHDQVKSVEDAKLDKTFARYQNQPLPALANCTPLVVVVWSAPPRAESSR